MIRLERYALLDIAGAMVAIAVLNGEPRQQRERLEIHGVAGAPFLLRHTVHHLHQIITVAFLEAGDEINLGRLEIRGIAHSNLQAYRSAGSRQTPVDAVLHVRPREERIGDMNMLGYKHEPSRPQL